MLHDQEGFVRLPDERLIYTSPPRTSLSLQPSPSYANKDSFSVQSSAGCVYLTNQRVRIPVYDYVDNDHLYADCVTSR